MHHQNFAAESPPMARTNVDDSWFIDKTKRRAALIHAITALPKDPEREADGLALDAWRTAQDYWKNGEKLVPEAVWTRGRFEPLITAGLAERRPEGIYVCGSQDYNEWLADKSKAGKKRAEAPRNADGTFIKSEKSPSSTDPAAIQQPSSTAGSVLAKTPYGSSTPPAADQPLPLPLPPALVSNELCNLTTCANPQAESQLPGDNPSAEAPVPEPHHYGDVAEPATPKSYRYKPIHLQLANAMRKKIAVKNPVALNGASDPEAWANELRLMDEVDGIRPADIVAVVGWVFDHRHWMTVVESPRSLRRNWQTIEGQYLARSDKGTGFQLS